MQLRQNVVRVQRFCIAMAETFIYLSSTLGVFLLWWYIENSVSRNIFMLLLSAFSFGSLLCRILAIIDHGWKGFFTTYKQEKDVSN